MMTTSVFVHMASVDKPKIGSAAFCGGRQRAMMSVGLNTFSCYRVKKGKAGMGVRRREGREGREGSEDERRKGRGGVRKEGKERKKRTERKKKERKER